MKLALVLALGCAAYGQFPLPGGGGTGVPGANGAMPDPGANGYMVRNSLNSDVARTFGGSCGLTVTNADGTGGNTSYTGSLPVTLKTSAYAIADGDCGSLLSFSSGSSIAVTLPQAGASSLFAAGWYACMGNRGAGTTTITPTTSTIDGHATLALTDGSTTTHGACIFSDGTNYFTAGLSGGGSGGSSSYSNLTQEANGSLTAAKAFNQATTACSLASTTITCDASAGNIWAFTITGNWTLAVTNPAAGVIWLIVTQDGTGARSLTYPASFLNPSSLDPIAAVITVQSCAYDGTHYLCSAAASTETSGIFRFPERTAPVSAPGSGKAACWADSGNHTLQCYNGATTSLWSVVKTDAGATSHQWVDSIPVTGIPHISQPAFSDLSGNATAAQGGTGLTSLTAYGVLTAGTTATGNFQQVSGTGTTGQVLTSAGAGALPAWSAPSSGNTLSTVGAGWLAPITNCAYCLAGVNESANTMMYVQIVPATSINVKTVTAIWGKAAAVGNIYAGFYSDVSGTCTTLLGQSAAASTNVASGNRLEMTFASTVNLSAGTPYWIAFAGDVTINLFESGNTGSTSSLGTVLNQTSHLRMGTAAGQLSAAAFPSSCGTVAIGTAHVVLAALLP